MGEERFRLLATKAPVGIFQTDSRGDCLFVNDRWAELAGLSHAEAAGQGWIEALHPEDRERVFREWYGAAEAGLEFVSEYRFQTPEGVTWVSGAATAIKTPRGDITGYIGTVTDITSIKIAEEERSRSERLLLLTADGVPALISYVDAGERYRFNNLAYENWFGRRREEVYGGAEIRVKDTGRGIAPDLLPHIFDLFAQGSRTLDRSEGGLGIGLTLTRSLLEMHGGTIQARSDGPGKGSEFLLRVPICGEYRPGESRESAEKAPGTRRRSILVVEDNRDSGGHPPPPPRVEGA
jgi:PAS domain S-box-containing protein